MKKVLSGILALALAGALTVPAFAAAGDITAEEVTTTVANEPEATVAPASLKESADDEEGMLRISSSTLLKIKLKLESDEAEGKNMSFLASQKLAEGEEISKEKIQFIDEKAISDDGTVTIQFRPRLNSQVGIYNMRANTKGATMFSKFYKTVANQLHPSLTNPAEGTPKNQDITVNVNEYTDAWKNVTKLYEVKNNEETEIPASDYSFETSSETPHIATLKIKTTGDWATQGPHKFRFKSTDIEYNTITFDVNITESEKVTSGITSELVSSTGKTIPDGLGGSITVPDTAKEGNNVDVTATVPNGYDIASVAYQSEDGESQTVTEAEGKYSFTMPNKAVKVIVTVAPKTYTLKLDLQGGSGIDNTTITGTVEDEELMKLPEETPTKEGFNFTNWRTGAENGDVVKNEHLNTAVKLVTFFKDADTRTLYAQWIPDGKFKVAYIVEEAGVDNKPSDATVYDKNTVTQIAIPEQEPTLKGYTFLGWQVKGDSSTYYKHGSSNNVYTNIDGIDKVLEFYAKWELKTYTITLQDGEESNTISGTVESLPVLTTPTKDGYDFKGWFTAETGGEKVEAITLDNISELTTLYALWEEIQTDDYELVSADRANSKVNVIKRTDESAYIIVATYAANGNLVKATIKDISNIQTTAAGEEVDVAGAFDGDYATAKVFMWNSLDKMQPRCPAIPVNK